MSTTTSLPSGAVKLGEVLTAIRAWLPCTVMEVGSPPMASAPSATGADGSVMSTKPTSSFGLLV
jgi:hypothetical protein